MLVSESWQSLEKFRDVKFRRMLFAFLGTKGNMSMRSLINFIGKPEDHLRAAWYIRETFTQIYARSHPRHV